MKVRHTALALLLLFCVSVGWVQAQKHPIPFLHQACLDGNHLQVQKLIDTYLAKAGKEKTINALNKKDNVVGVPPLYAATTKGHLRVVKLLVEVHTFRYQYQAHIRHKAGADINLETADGSTPLHAAAFGGYLEVVRYLVENGAAINALNEHNITPLAAAEYNDHYRIVKYLQDKQQEGQKLKSEL